MSERALSPTEIGLLAVHRAPAIPLADVCEKYLGMKYEHARRKANKNALPFPAYRLDESKKAPWMVNLAHLAEYIDAQGDKASTAWAESQV